eukprot:469427_1
MCNAHGVVDSTSIRVRKYGESKKYSAKIKYIGHECDLAVLTVDDDKFWKSRKDKQALKAIEFCDVRSILQDTITVLGYPKGGDDLSVTQGVVSRVGFTHYAHTLEHLLTIQIDAAINDGNSGGPCLDTNGRVVGVAFQGITDADNIGYCIPVRVVNHFMACKRANRSYVVPSLCLVYSPIENNAMKQYLKMEKKANEEDDEYYSDDEMQGILVAKIYPFTDAANKLKKEDVILEIDGVQIGDDGTINYGKNSRIDLNYMITNKFDGDCVSLKVLREGEVLDIEVILNKHKPLCPVHLFNDPVEYFIFGGLVFIALSRPYLQHKFGHDTWLKKTPSTLKYIYYHRMKEFEDQQCIVLSQVLASDITVGYHSYKHYVLDTIDDDQHNKPRNIKHLARCVDHKCSNRDANAFIKFKFTSEHMIVLNIQQGIDATPQILKRHKIEYDRSDNLRILNEQNNDTAT